MQPKQHDDERSPIDKVIKKAMDDGKFDNLPGHGQPFPHEDDNPWEDPTSWAAHRILKSAGFSLPWIEERNEIEYQLTTARSILARSRNNWRDLPSHLYGEERWQIAVEKFRQRCMEINHMIRNYNLKAPMVELHIVVIDVDYEIGKVVGS